MSENLPNSASILPNNKGLKSKKYGHLSTAKRILERLEIQTISPFVKI